MEYLLYTTPGSIKKHVPEVMFVVTWLSVTVITRHPTSPPITLFIYLILLVKSQMPQ